MNKVIGVSCVVLMAWLLSTASPPAPKITNAVPATPKAARFHFWRGEGDTDRTLDVTLPSDGNGTGRLLEHSGNIYVDRDSNIRVGVTRDVYFGVSRTDIGSFAGYRPAFRGTEQSTASLGFRYSPVRLFYDTVAPDIAISPNWAGIGVSAYAPEYLVGETWKHVGVGAWYGYPYGGLLDGPPGWTVGLSLSIR